MILNHSWGSSLWTTSAQLSVTIVPLSQQQLRLLYFALFAAHWIVYSTQCTHLYCTTYITLHSAKDTLQIAQCTHNLCTAHCITFLVVSLCSLCGSGYSKDGHREKYSYSDREKYTHSDGETVALTERNTDSLDTEIYIDSKKERYIDTDSDAEGQWV